MIPLLPSQVRLRRATPLARLFRLPAGLDPRPALEAALARHSCFRLGFEEQGQVLHERVDLPWNEGEAGRAFELSRPPLLRAFAWEDRLLLEAHPLALDCWSLGLAPSRAGPATGLLAPQLFEARPESSDFLQFVRWQHDWLAGPEALVQRQFWAERLAGLAELFPQGGDPAGRRLPLELAPEVSRRARKRARQLQVSLFELLLAGFFRFLREWTGRSDLCVGTPVANRDRPGHERMLGPLGNQLAIRVLVRASQSFPGLVRRVAQEVRTVRAHADLPEECLGESSPFSVRLILNQAPRLAAAEAVPLERSLAKYPLTLMLSDDPEGLRGWLEYRASLADQEAAAGLAGRWKEILAAALEET